MLEMMMGTARRRRFSVIDPSVSGALGRADLTASAGAATDIPPQGGKGVSEPGSLHFVNHVSAPDKRRCLNFRCRLALKKRIGNGGRSGSVGFKPERMSLPPLCLFSESTDPAIWQSRRTPCYCSVELPEVAGHRRSKRVRSEEYIQYV
jgi:hypothetical protein